MPAFADPEIYRDILDGLRIGVSVLDLKKKIIFWSDGAQQITGYARIDVLGHPCSDNILLRCNQSNCEMCNQKCPVATALRDACPVEAISFIHHKSGHRVPVRISALPLRDKHGSIIAVIQTFEGEFAVNGPDPNQRSMKERGWLDDITGLPNQAMMQSHLREALGTFAELQIPFGVLCFEVPEFDRFRTHYGRQAASSMLQVLARTLRNSVWAADFVGRWSEDRFLVILIGCSDDELEAISERMVRMVSSTTIEWWGEQLSVPISTVRTSAQASDSIESLLLRLRLAPVNQLSLLGHPAAMAATAAPKD
ncbi:MAG: diguanylate cyclase domain-containing protein [Candidatus Sulfotelmatobacter sp.]